MSVADTDAHVNMNTANVMCVFKLKNIIVLQRKKHSNRNISLHNCNMSGDKICERSVSKFQFFGDRQHSLL